MALDRQVRVFLALVAAPELPKVHEMTPVQARAQADGLRELLGEGPQLPLVEDLVIAPGIPARRYEPSEPAFTVVWLHGGGWVFGNLDTHDAMCRMLALAAGARVISVAYRLAPEHPFPAAVEDAWEAVQWAAGAFAQPLAVGGDSAGGNLAAVCALRARDRGGPPVAAQLLVYPVTANDDSLPSMTRYGSGPETFLTYEEMAWFRGHYLGEHADVSHPEVSPLRAGDHAGLPPAIVVTAEYDPLRDEGFQYVERLRAAAVEVTHHHYDGMIHGFFSRVNLFRTGDEAVARAGADLRSLVLAGD